MECAAVANQETPIAPNTIRIGMDTAQNSIVAKVSCRGCDLRKEVGQEGPASAHMFCCCHASTAQCMHSSTMWLAGMTASPCGRVAS
jgi:hypothetical protein